MRPSFKYFFAGIGAISIVAAIVLYTTRHKQPLTADEILALYQENAGYGKLTIEYPLDETLFPPEIVPPTFRWNDDAGSGIWLISIAFQDDQNRINLLCNESTWTPENRQWQVIKNRSSEKDALVTILGVNRNLSAKIVSSGGIKIRTSKDKVGAPIFYREVNLPFADAVKDPSLIRWRFGDISSPQQPLVVLQNLPVCGNCHSFSERARQRK
jgi:hypothetical protein